MIKLSPERRSALLDALTDAFTPEDLDFKVADPLRVPATERSAARSVAERAARLVEWAESMGRLQELFQEALRANPSNTRLRQLNEASGLLPASTYLVEVMREVLPARGEQAWLRGLVEAQRQVCRVRAGDVVCSGFLVGAEEIMTSAFVLKNQEALSRVEIMFEGAAFGLHAQKPVVASVLDSFVVLRLSAAAGRELGPTSANVNVRSRGWIVPPSSPGPAPASKSPLVIVQYLDRTAPGEAADAPRVSADSRGLIAVEGDTLFYDTATHSGSSGAPCFDAQWRLIGVHVGLNAEHTNFGRSAQAILAALRAQGFDWDTSRGIYQLEKRMAPVYTGKLDEAIRGIASGLEPSDGEGWSIDLEELNVPLGECWAWAEAAAVHASFDPDTLKPFGTGSSAARVALLLESRQVGGRWVISESLRKRSLHRLATRGLLRVARAANPGDPSDPVDVALGQLIDGARIDIATLGEPEPLRALFTAADWLDGISKGLPDRDAMRAALERAMLLAPLRHLTGVFFAGREQELERLRRHVDDRMTRPPLFIHAPGGAGKSALLAHFILGRVSFVPDPSAWRPLIYLDFDRPELDATNLAGVVTAMLQQLGPQVPALAADIAGFAARGASRKVANQSARRVNRRRQNLAHQVARPTDDIVFEALSLFEKLPRGGPILLILDTLEEVQFASPDAIPPLVALVHEMQRRAPQLRPLLAGRIPVEEGVEPMSLGPLSRADSEALLGNELPPEVASQTKLVSQLAEICQGNPLSLRLAAELVRREVERAAALIEELTEELQELLSDAIVQGRLYERILGHIHDANVKAVAYPGLVLRRITWELIRDVLAAPCGLGELDELGARKLLDELAKEVALVRQGRDPDELQLRPELRRVVREDFARDAKTLGQRSAIHQAALSFYAARGTPADRAEEIYHRLALGQRPDEVDKRWLTGIEPFLRDAVSELSPEAATYLANRVGGVVGAADIASAPQLEWEQWAGKRAADLLKFGQPARALEVLAGRSERLPASSLHYVESLARRMLPEPDLEGAEACAERAVSSARWARNSEELRDALEELVHVRRLRGDTAGVLRGLAELADLGDALGDDLVILQTDVEALETFDFGDHREQFSQNAVRVFNRLPDELVAKAPELSRRVAAQVGGSDPATLQRVMRVVGTGSLDRDAAAGLREVLAGWRDVDGQVASLVPDEHKSPREVANAARYLIATHEMGNEVAGKFARWLSAVVTPKKDSYE